MREGGVQVRPVVWLLFYRLPDTAGSMGGSSLLPAQFGRVFHPRTHVARPPGRPRRDLSAALYALNFSVEGADPGECELDIQGHASVSQNASCYSTGRVARDEHIWREMDARELHNLITRLAPNEQYVTKKLLEEYNCAEIAREMGVTRQRVHQIKTSAFQKIRAWMGSPLAAA